MEENGIKSRFLYFFSLKTFTFVNKMERPEERGVSD